MTNFFWAYSLEVYARPIVQELCLSLQENQGADVNLILYCCWQGSMGHGLKADEVASLLAICEPWRRGVVIPLREVRVRLKRSGDSSVYKKAKQAELKAEQVQQALLWCYTPSTRRVDCLTPLEKAKEVVNNNLSLYWKTLNSGEGGFQALIEALYKETD